MLIANRDPRAGALLREAVLLLQQQADRIADSTWRDSFLQIIQANQALLQEYQAVNAGQRLRRDNVLPAPASLNLNDT